MPEESDHWHRWLLQTRFGGDADNARRELAQRLYPVRDKVLDNAGLRPQDTLLDVGAGDGLIAFGALERPGFSGHVIIADVSADLLGHCRQVAAAREWQDRCSFILAPADGLSAVTTAMVNVVTTRSVLIYVRDKAAALREFYRVLAPGGRISLGEPINVLMASYDPARFSGYSTADVGELAAKVQALYEAIQPSGADPMIDFDDRDLVRHAEEAGFDEVELELRITVRNRKRPVPWNRFLRTSGNPLVPTIGEALDRSLSAAEIVAFTAHLRPLVEAGTGQERMAFAFLTARKDGPDAV
ncbi:MAG: class I SAM-dependent methyltransferase [Streptosporangiaceae bacterium]